MVLLWCFLSILVAYFCASISELKCFSSHVVFRNTETSIQRNSKNFLEQNTDESMSMKSHLIVRSYFF